MHKCVSKLGQHCFRPWLVARPFCVLRHHNTFWRYGCTRLHLLNGGICWWWLGFADDSLPMYLLFGAMCLFRQPMGLLVFNVAFVSITSMNRASLQKPYLIIYKSRNGHLYTYVSIKTFAMQSIVGHTFKHHIYRVHLLEMNDMLQLILFWKHW